MKSKEVRVLHDVGDKHGPTKPFRTLLGLPFPTRHRISILGASDANDRDVQLVPDIILKDGAERDQIGGPVPLGAVAEKNRHTSTSQLLRETHNVIRFGRFCHSDAIQLGIQASDLVRLLTLWSGDFFWFAIIQFDCCITKSIYFMLVLLGRLLNTIFVVLNGLLLNR